MSDQHRSIAIVESKLDPPIPPADEVRRDRLDGVLDAGHQVVVVTAPAGYGKSTAVAGWVRRSPDLRVGWVSLDPFDRSPMSFWRHVAAALAQLIPGLAEADEILLERGGPAPEFLAALIHGILVDGDPIVLVIDDLHRVDESTIGDGLTSLVERCAGILRLISISRSTPPLPLARWSAEGRAIQIRSDLLAFRSDEAAALMERFDVDQLQGESLDRLNEHVEGWAVGLLLSGLTLQGRPDLATSLDDLLRSDRHLTEYLVTEVLSRLPPEIRRFALLMSVPPWFDREIARRLTGRDDAGPLLDRLVDSNPFVIPIPSPPGYRFHHLVRSLLASMLQADDPSASERAHHVAADLMNARGLIGEALTTLLAIGAVDEAFDLVTAPLLRTHDHGQVRELVQWLEMLGDARPTDRLRALDFATALLIAGRVDEARSWIDQAAHMGRADVPTTTLETTLRVTTLAVAGHLDEALEILPELEAAGPETEVSARIDSRRSAQIVRLSLATGQLDRAERWLPHVERHPERVVSQVLAPALGAWLQLERGMIAEALRSATSSCSAAERLGAKNNVAEFDALLSRGRAELMSLQLDALRTTLEALADTADQFDFPFFLLRLWPLQMAERALAEGWPAALEFIGSRDPANYPRRGGHLAIRSAELRALALTNCGLLDEAARIIATLPEGPRRCLLVARHDIARGDLDDAEAALGPHAGWSAPQRLEALLLRTRTRTGRSANDILGEALQLARATGMLAPVALEGQPIESALGQVDLDRLCPALAAWRRSVRADEHAVRTVTLLEPLTDKERAVLQRLPSHATYRAIGAQLYVSVNTVKTYVSSIYRKLGVSSRAEAVEVAQRCGLLDT